MLSYIENRACYSSIINFVFQQYLTSLSVVETVTSPVKARGVKVILQPIALCIPTAHEFRVISACTYTTKEVSLKVAK